MLILFSSGSCPIFALIYADDEHISTALDEGEHTGTC